MFRGKKYQESAKLIDKGALYDTAEAMELVVKTAWSRPLPPSSTRPLSCM